MLKLDTPDHDDGLQRMEATSMNDPKTQVDPEALWDVKATARFLRVSKSWAYKAAERGELPAIRIGSLLRFQPAAVRAYVTGLATKGRA